MGLNDDSSYASIARGFAATGHVSYNGWTAVMLLPQLLWAAPFIKLFGFSFLVTRVSTVALALFLVPVVYFLGRESGLLPPFAAFAAVLSVLSPLTMPEVVSFMSDVPAFLFFALCLYASIRAWKAGSAAACVRWGALAAIAGFLGGLERQIYWLAPLLFLPVIVWVQRPRKRAVIGIAIAWAAVIVAIIVSLGWYAAQPYTLHEDLAAAWRTMSAGTLLHRQLLLVCQYAFTLALLLVPLLAGFVAPGLRAAPRILSGAAIAIVLATGAASLHWESLQAPLMGNVLTHYGAVPYGVVVFGDKVLVLGRAAGVAISMAVVLCCAGCLLAVWARRKGLGMRRFPRPTVAPLTALGALFTVSSLAVILARSAGAAASDRYVIPYVPLAAIPLLWFFQQHLRHTISRSSWLALAMFVMYGIAVTHDAFSGARARLAAANDLQQAGIPRTEISAGFDYDVLTQLETWGYVNHNLIVFPPGAFHQPVCAGPEDVRPWYLWLTPSVQPRYVISLSRIAGWSSGPAGPVSYTTWLPPGRREVFAQAVPEKIRFACR